MYFDRFDIVLAHYLYCMYHHTGQGSKLYARLSKINTYFNAGRPLAGVEDLNENAREIYLSLVLKGRKGKI